MNKQHKWTEVQVEYEGEGQSEVQICYDACLECGTFRRSTSDAGGNTIKEYFNLADGNWVTEIPPCDFRA